MAPAAASTTDVPLELNAAGRSNVSQAEHQGVTQKMESTSVQNNGNIPTDPALQLEVVKQAKRDMKVCLLGMEGGSGKGVSCDAVIGEFRGAVNAVQVTCDSASINRLLEATSAVAKLVQQPDLAAVAARDTLVQLVCRHALRQAHYMDLLVSPDKSRTARCPLAPKDLVVTIEALGEWYIQIIAQLRKKRTTVSRLLKHKKQQDRFKLYEQALCQLGDTMGDLSSALSPIQDVTGAEDTPESSPEVVKQLQSAAEAISGAADDAASKSEGTAVTDNTVVKDLFPDLLLDDEPETTTKTPMDPFDLSTPANANDVRADSSSIALAVTQAGGPSNNPFIQSTTVVIAGGPSLSSSNPFETAAKTALPTNQPSSTNPFAAFVSTETNVSNPFQQQQLASEPHTSINPFQRPPVSDELRTNSNPFAASDFRASTGSISITSSFASSGDLRLSSSSTSSNPFAPNRSISETVRQSSSTESLPMMHAQSAVYPCQTMTQPMVPPGLPRPPAAVKPYGKPYAVQPFADLVVL